MSTETIEPNITSPRERALDLLRGEILAVILEAEEPLRTVDIAREAGERLGLQLNDTDAGGLASVVRMLLDSDPLFSQSNRQWDLALRMGRAEGDRRKPVESAIEDFIDLLGRPALPASLARLLTAVYGRTDEHHLDLIRRITSAGRCIAQIEDRVIPQNWLLQVTSDDAGDVEWDNFDPIELLDPYQQPAARATGDTPLEYAVSLIQQAEQPVPNRVLQYFVWTRFRDFNPVGLVKSLQAEDRVRAARGAAWETSEERQRDLDALLELIRNPDAAGDLVVSTMPGAEESAGMLGQTAVRVTPEDVNQIDAFMRRSKESWRLSDILQQVLEAFPGSRTYADMEAALREALQKDVRFRWVGFDRFRLADTIPDEVESLPEGLAFDDTEYFDDDEELVDLALPVDEWRGGLAEQVQHPLVQGVGDDCSQPGKPPSKLSLSLPLHHKVTGTIYIRHADRSFFPSEPDLLELTFIAPDETEFPVWFNNRLGILYGLIEWFDANLPWTGGLFHLRAGEAPGSYRLQYTGEVEPLMEVPVERLQKLIQLRSDAGGEAMPLTEVARNILQMHEEPVHFVTLFTEINIVRRTRRATLASILSGQKYFASGSDGLWKFDEKKAQKSKKKAAGKRPKRAYYEDDEEEEL